jgi:hypothetical protein
VLKPAIAVQIRAKPVNALDTHLLQIWYGIRLEIHFEMLAYLQLLPVDYL